MNPKTETLSNAKFIGVTPGVERGVRRRAYVTFSLGGITYVTPGARYPVCDVGGDFNLCT